MIHESAGRSAVARILLKDKDTKVANAAITDDLGSSFLPTSCAKYLWTGFQRMTRGRKFLACSSIQMKCQNHQQKVDRRADITF